MSKRLRVFLAFIAATLMVSGSSLMITSSAEATGGGNEECPPGTIQLAKHNWQGGSYVEEGSGVASVTGTAQGGTFTADSGYLVSHVIVKGSNNAKTMTFNPPVSSGSFNNDGLINNGGQTAEISNVKVCGSKVPDQPDDKVEYSEWVDGAKSCESKTVTQTRTKTVTTHTWDGTKYVPSTTTTTETRTRPMTEAELKECEGTPPPDDSCPPLTGSVKTTLPDGSVVNGNIYTDKNDVYISGDQLGDVTTVYIRVTDPSGSVVLSATKTATVTDGSFGPVQLPTFNDSPNNGDEYKVWVSSTTDFESKCTKFDNFKVRGEEPPPVDNPLNPTVSAAAKACVNKGEATGVVDVTVNNTDDATNDEVVYDVTLNGVTKQVTIADGQSAVVQFTGLAPGNYPVAVKGDDDTKASTTVKVEECTATSTPTPTPTPTPTVTPTPTPTVTTTPPTPTSTPTTPTGTPTSTPTNTPTKHPTPTPTVNTPTSTPTSTPTFVPPSTGGGEWPPSSFGSSDYSFAGMMGKLMVLGGFALFLVLGFERWGRRKSYYMA